MRRLIFFILIITTVTPSLARARVATDGQSARRVVRTRHARRIKQRRAAKRAGAARADGPSVTAQPALEMDVPEDRLLGAPPPKRPRARRTPKKKPIPDIKNPLIKNP